VQATLLEVIRARIAEDAQELQRCETLLAEGKVAAARAALAAARTGQEETREALRPIANLAGPHRWVIGDLAVVRARIVRTLPVPMKLDVSDLEDPRDRALFGTLHGIGQLVAGALGFQWLEAEVLEVRGAGSRYASRTRMGRQHPGQKRDDLAGGRKVELESSAPDTGVGRLQEGREYWLALTPRNAHKALPKEAGTGDHTMIVLAIPVKER
jgi:hypothetical protein